MKSIISCIVLSVYLCSCASSSPGQGYGNTISGAINQTVYSSPASYGYTAAYRPAATSALSAGVLSSGGGISIRGSGGAPYERTNSSYATYENNRHRQLVSHGNLMVSVDSIAKAIDSIRTLATNIEGFATSVSTNYIELIVPAARLTSFMNTISGLGTCVYQQTSSKEITNEYYDAEMRLAIADSSLKRYTELLGKAENVEAALKVEKELERIQTEIEMLKGKLQLMKHDVEMASINVTLMDRSTPTVKPGPLGYVFVGLYSAVKWLFVWE